MSKAFGSLLSVSFPHRVTYLSGKESFGSVLAQGCEATRPRTLTCADGLLSCSQDLIQFVCGAVRMVRDSESESCLASRDRDLVALG